MDYLFTLKYQLPEQERDLDALVERLGAAGCDDALVGIGLPGRLALAFNRGAQSGEAAMLSALQDVKRVIPTARLVEAAPDLVGLSDIAEFVGVSRQNMRKLMLAHPDSFPLAMHEGSTSLWHLVAVLEWLQSRGGYAIAPALLEVARATRQVNQARAASSHAALKPELMALFD